MGEVKEAVKGSGRAKPKRKLFGKDKSTNLVDELHGLREEISRLTAIKDNDALTEGDDARADNVRKAAQLRAAHTLLTSAATLMEDY